MAERNYRYLIPLPGKQRKKVSFKSMWRWPVNCYIYSMFAVPFNLVLSPLLDHRVIYLVCDTWINVHQRLTKWYY
jgi:hypothetical protein